MAYQGNFYSRKKPSEWNKQEMDYMKMEVYQAIDLLKQRYGSKGSFFLYALGLELINQNAPAREPEDTTNDSSDDRGNAFGAA